MIMLISSLTNYDPKTHHLHVVTEEEAPIPREDGKVLPDKLAANHCADVNEIISINPGSTYEPGELVKIPMKSSALA